MATTLSGDIGDNTIHYYETGFTIIDRAWWLVEAWVFSVNMPWWFVQWNNQPWYGWIVYHKMPSLKYKCFFITQNIFMPGKWARTISLNCQSIVLFCNQRDGSQIRMLARQIMQDKSNYFMSAYELATKKPYCYLLIDLTPHSSEEYKLRTKIFQGEDGVVFASLQKLTSVHLHIQRHEQSVEVAFAIS